MVRMFTGLTGQYVSAFRTVAAPLWLCVAVLLLGGPWLGQTLMVMAGGGDVDPATLPRKELRLICHALATLFFGIGTLVGLFASPTYVFRLPISSRCLVAWQFLVACITVGLCNSVMILAYRWLFGAVLSSVTSLPMMTAVHLLIWLVWMFVPAASGGQGMPGLSGAPLRDQARFVVSRLCRWLPAVALFAAYAVYRNAGVDQAVVWQHLTVLDVVVPVGISVWVAGRVVAEVECQRHGDHRAGLLRERAGESILARLAHRDIPVRGFETARAAHRWYHWQSGRMLLVMATFFTVPLLLVVFGMMHLDNGNNRLEGIAVMQVMMPALGSLLIGTTLGMDTVNPRYRREMRKHLAVLPVSDCHLSVTMLSSFVRTVGGLWAVVTGLCAVAVVLLAADAGPGAVVREFERLGPVERLGVWAVPLHVLISLQVVWTVGGLSALLAWTGREQFVAKVVLLLAVLGLPGLIGTWLFVPAEYQQVVLTTALAVLAVCTVAGVAWSFLTARRRMLLEPGLVRAVLPIWMLEALLCLLLLPAPLTVRLAIAGLLGLAVLPVTAGPLAVSWNRHR